MICCYIILPSFNLTDSMHKVNSTKTWIFLVGRLSASSFLQNKEEGHDLSSKYPLTNALVIEWEQISAASHHDLVENYPRRTAALIGTNQRVWFWKVEFKMWNMYMTSDYKGQIWVKCNNNTKNRWQKKVFVLFRDYNVPPTLLPDDVSQKDFSSVKKRNGLRLKTAERFQIRSSQKPPSVAASKRELYVLHLCLIKNQRGMQDKGCFLHRTPSNLEINIYPITAFTCSALFILIMSTKLGKHKDPPATDKNI